MCIWCQKKKAGCAGTCLQWVQVAAPHGAQGLLHLAVAAAQGCLSQTITITIAITITVTITITTTITSTITR